MTATTALYLAAGGALGTLARYALSGLVQPAGGSFPWGTLTVNVSGAFALGFVLQLLLGSNVATPDVRAGVTIGFLGAFTTMSTFAYEAVSLVRDGDLWRAGLYVAATVVGSLAAAAVGLAAAHRLL